MKKLNYWLIFVFSALFFFGCKKKDTTNQVSAAPQITNPNDAFLAPKTTMNRVAVLEDFSGVMCSHCPEAHLEAKAISAANPGKFIIISIHPNYFAAPVTGWANFTTPKGNAIDEQVKPMGYPAGTMNRLSCSTLGTTPKNTTSLIAMTKEEWSKAATKVMSMIAPVNLGAKATYDYTTRTLTVKVDIYYTDIETVPNNINVVLLQNKLMSAQAGAPDPNNYEQNHVFRDMITSGNWGETITEPTTVGSKISKTYAYQVPEDYNGIGTEGGGLVVIGDLRVVAFITREKLDILNAVEVDIR